MKCDYFSGEISQGNSSFLLVLRPVLNENSRSFLMDPKNQESIVFIDAWSCREDMWDLANIQVKESTRTEKTRMKLVRSLKKMVSSNKGISKQSVNVRISIPSLGVLHYLLLFVLLLIVVTLKNVSLVTITGGGLSTLTCAWNA